MSLHSLKWDVEAACRRRHFIRRVRAQEKIWIFRWFLRNGDKSIPLTQWNIFLLLSILRRLKNDVVYHFLYLEPPYRFSIVADLIYHDSIIKLYIFTNPSVRAGYDTGSIFYQSQFFRIYLFISLFQSVRIYQSLCVQCFSLSPCLIIKLLRRQQLINVNLFHFLHTKIHSN